MITTGSPCAAAYLSPVFEPLRASGLVVLVEDVELYLRHAPVRRARYYFFEGLEGVVDRETLEAYLSFFAHFFEERYAVVFFNLFPDAGAEVVKHVDVDIVDLKAAKLFVEELFKVRVRLRVYDRAFRHERDLFAVAVGERLAKKLFAPSIDVGRVDVVHAVVYRIAHDLDSGFFVGGQAHRPEAEARDLQSCLSKVCVLHDKSLPTHNNYTPGGIEKRRARKRAVRKKRGAFSGF